MQIVLTHEHADAVLGLDDIRAVQPYSATNSIDPTPIYVTEYAMQRYLILDECVYVHFTCHSFTCPDKSNKHERCNCMMLWCAGSK